MFQISEMNMISSVPMEIEEGIQMSKTPEERILYSAIVDRPPLKFDGETKLVVWPIVNLEVWEIQRAMARQVLPRQPASRYSPIFPTGHGTSTECAWATGASRRCLTA
jgi:hypothetical protein